MRIKKFSTLLAALSLITMPVFGQNPDETYNQKIKEYTTDKKFLPQSVLNILNDPGIPSPLKQFGQIIGAPGVMHRTDEIYGYFKKLSESSSRLKMEQIGTTEEGRAINLVTITSEANMAKLDHYKKQLALLADPRKVNPEQLTAIISDSKPVYYFNAGLHSPEMGSPEMVMELAYRLITDTTPETKQLLDNVIILINPVSEPDGRDKQTDWYYRYTKGRKEFEDGFPFSPPYWGKYVFHDNNRDGLQNTQQLTKAIYKMYYEWHPTIIHDLHESIPLLYVSTGTGPYNEAIDPITIGEWQIFANHDVTTLTSQGLPGTFTWAFYDGWNPSYVFWIANNHNAIGRFYETFGNAGADTFVRDLSSDSYAGDPVTSREWYRPDPATPKVVWSSRNNVNYMESGVLASLQYTSDNAKLLLKNFYQKGVNSIRKGKEEKPRAFVIPKEQRDPYMAAHLVNQLQVQGIEVHQAASGEYIIKLEQPYRNLAVSLLTKQNYPKEAKFPPYDDIGWTMSYLYGVDVQAKDSLEYNASDLKLISGNVKYEGKVTGSASNYVLNYKAQNTAISALYWLKRKNSKAKAFIATAVVNVAGITDTLSAGSILLQGVTSDQAKTIATQFGLDLETTPAASFPKQHEVNLPRIAIYHSWSYTQDEGWARYTFDQHGIPYTYIDKDELKAGGLKNKFDVILIPRLYGSVSDFIHEIDKKFGPMPFTKTAEYPSHGTPDATNDMTGGPGFEGIGQLKQFADAGGVLITLGNSSKLVAEAGITRSLEEAGASGLFHPGSVVSVKIRKPGDPVLYGYPENFHVFRGIGPVLQTDKFNRNLMLVQYGSKPLKDEEEYNGPILGMPAKKEVKKADDEASKKSVTAKETPYVLSGMVRNEQMIIGHGAIFSIPTGNGRLVAFTFDPLHRFQNLHDAPLVWNAIINWDNLK
ncbi:MAG: M14 family zinc carboxypeptidase [Chryseolinea sp.]